MGSSGGLNYKSAAGRWVIAATVLGSGMAAIDATVVGIALPTIGRHFGATLGTLQWVVTGYTLTLAALLLLGGSLGDLYGRKRVFCVGVIWFGLSSIVCGLAPDSTALVVARVVQGVGGALLTPGSLAILQASFSPTDRGAAIGAWSGLGGLASAAGPLLGGYLIAAASWRWIFYINVPLGVLVLLLTMRHVPESRDLQASRKVDVKGAATGMLALAGLTYALIEGPEHGFASLAVLAALAAGLVGGIVFMLLERASAAPMLPLALFGNRQFSVTNGVTLIIYAALGGALFLLPVELQVVNHYTALEAGAALIPLTVVMLLLSARSGRLAAKIGPRLQMAVGPVVVGAGMALLMRSTGARSYAVGVLPAVLVFALGLAITVAPLTTTALGAASAERAGIASAVNNYVARVGSLLAVAVLPALAGVSGRSYMHAATFSVGFRKAMIISASLCAMGGAIAAIGIRNTTDVRTQQPDNARTGPVNCALDAPPVGTELLPQQLDREPSSGPI
ncbi:MAG: DHA2 family efflux MFS transporter permease subunit [Acidimicrobiales bacterium]